MIFAARQHALGRIVSYKTDLWTIFSFPSQPSTEEQQVLSPNKMTTVSHADGLALCGERSRVLHPHHSRGTSCKRSVMAPSCFSFCRVFPNLKDSVILYV